MRDFNSFQSFSRRLALAQTGMNFFILKPKMPKSSPLYNLRWLLTFYFHFYRHVSSSERWKKKKGEKKRKDIKIQFTCILMPCTFFTFANFKHIHISAKRSWKWSETKIESDCFWISLSSFSRFCSTSVVKNPENNCTRKSSIVDDLMKHFYTANNVIVVISSFGNAWRDINLIANKPTNLIMSVAYMKSFSASSRPKRILRDACLYVCVFVLRNAFRFWEKFKNFDMKYPMTFQWKC